MRSPRGSRLTALAVVLAAVVAGAGAVAALPAQQTLVVADAATGDRLLAVPVEEGSTVTLAYTHSVELTPVRDVYTVRDGRLEMTRMEFESYGWGLPAGADVRTVNGTFVFDPEGSYATLFVAPGERAGHELRVDGRRYDLVGLSGGDTVRLTVERRSVAGAIRG